MEKLIKYLKENVQYIKDNHPDEMDEASWSHEQGMLITGNEAESIIQVIEDLHNLKEGLKKYTGNPIY